MNAIIGIIVEKVLAFLYNLVIGWWKEKQQTEANQTENKELREKLENAKTPEEREQALRDLVNKLKS